MSEIKGCVPYYKVHSQKKATVFYKHNIVRYELSRTGVCLDCGQVFHNIETLTRREYPFLAEDLNTYKQVKIPKA